MTALRDTLAWMTLKIIPLHNYGLFFSLVCFMLDQALVGHLYSDKGLLLSSSPIPSIDSILLEKLITNSAEYAVSAERN